jgi:hypothetical protein
MSAEPIETVSDEERITHLLSALLDARVTVPEHSHSIYGGRLELCRRSREQDNRNVINDLLDMSVFKEKVSVAPDIAVMLASRHKDACEVKPFIFAYERGNGADIHLDTRSPVWNTGVFFPPGKIDLPKLEKLFLESVGVWDEENFAHRIGLLTDRSSQAEEILEAVGTARKTAHEQLNCVASQRPLHPSIVRAFDTAADRATAHLLATSRKLARDIGEEPARAVMEKLSGRWITARTLRGG